MSNAPDPIRTRQLIGIRPGQYWGGGPPGKPFGCCWLFNFTLGEMTFLDNFEFFWTKTLKILSGVVGTFVQYLGGPEELDGKSSVFG